MSAAVRTIDTIAEPDATYSPTDRVILSLLVAGMAAALVMLLILLKEIDAQLKPGEFYNPDIVKPTVYYVAHGIQIALMLAAGFLTLLSTDLRKIQREYIVVFGLYIGAAMLMAVRGYTLSDLLSTKLVDNAGPFPCFISVLVFVGARRRYWRVIGKAMVTLAVLFSTLSVLALVTLSNFSRDRVIASMAGFLNALYWPAAWLALGDHPRGSWLRRLRFIPIGIYSFMSFFTQTRLNFIMIFSLLAMYSYLQYRRNDPQAAFWITGAALIVWVGLFTAIFLRDTSAVQTLGSVSDAFSSRIDEDTRTGQLQRFFESVELRELVLGRGALGTWDWGHITAWRGGTDVGYLTLLLYGGLPLLLTFIAAHLLPGYRALAGDASGWRLTAAGIVVLFSIRMFSSTYLGLTLDYYPFLFCVGACISREPSAAVAKRPVLQAKLTHANPLVYQ